MERTPFSLRQSTPLPTPASLEREWRLNGVQGAELAPFREEHLGTVGYPYPWGQIVESRCDEAAPGDPVDPAPPVLTWGFVLSALHGEFLDAGANLGELADLAVTLLDEIASAAQAEDRTDVIPAFTPFLRRARAAALSRFSSRGTTTWTPPAIGSISSSSTGHFRC